MSSSSSHSEESSTSDDSDSDQYQYMEDENEFGLLQEACSVGYCGIVPYADEPLADEEWTRQYNIDMVKKNQELIERKSRLDGSKQLNSWCTCGHCKIDGLQNPDECVCCHEIKECADILGSDVVLQEVKEPPPCITLHPAFATVCLNKWSLRSAAVKYKKIDKSKRSRTGSEEKFLTSISYRELIQMVYGCLDRINCLRLPACAYCKIRTALLPNVENESHEEDKN